MTRKETAQLLSLLSATYPRFNFTADDMKLAAWHEMLSDLPGDVVGVAVRRMIATLQYPPTIADIRGAVAEAANDATGAISAGEAWAKVTKAISYYGFYASEKARQWLGDEIWRAVEMCGGWAYECTSEDSESVRSAQFERRYNAMLEQKKSLIQIPASARDNMKRLVGGLAEKMRLTDGGSNFTPYNPKDE